MAFKYFAVLALIAVTGAIELNYHHHAPLLVKKLVEVEHDAPAHYDFEYAVHDEHTGDIKSQKESRHNDAVEGYYTLIDADGHKRTVHYTANDKEGFNAKVEREYVGGHYEAPKQVKFVAPVAHKIIAPVAHKVIATPVHKVIYDHHDGAHSHVTVSNHGADYHY